MHAATRGWRDLAQARSLPLAQRIRLAVDLRLPLRLAWESAPRHLVAMVPLRILSGLLPLAGVFLTKRVVDALSQALASPHPAASFPQVVVLVVAAGALAAVGMVVGGIAGLVNQAQSMLVADHVQNLIHAKCLQLDLEHYEDPSYYDTLQRARQEGFSVPVRIVQNLTSLAQGVVNLGAMLGVLISFSPFLVLVLALAAVPSVATKLCFAEIRYRWQRDRTEKQRLLSSLDAMITGSHYAKEIRLFHLGNLLRSRWRELRGSLRRETMQLAARQTKAGFLAQALGAAVVFLAVLFVVRGSLSRGLSLGSLVMYYQAFQRGLSSLKSLMMDVADLYEGNLFLTNLQEFLQQTPTVPDPPRPVPLPAPLRGHVRFEHVSFGYPRSEALALHDVCLEVRPGEVVALVGENGSGKTTIIKLLCRLYDPSAGRIVLDGFDLRDFAVGELRRHVSVIFQDFAHYPFSARENIWVGDVGLDPCDEAIPRAAMAAGIHEALTRLPQGYETLLARWLTGGQELSIGQWQRLALARAFLRDAPLVVLDEPTSALDARAEYEIFTHLKGLLRGRSAILVSHRFSTVRLADRIYVLRAGRIVEQGTHHELLAQGGLYATMFTLQASAFRE